MKENYGNNDVDGLKSRTEGSRVMAPKKIKWNKQSKVDRFSGVFLRLSKTAMCINVSEKNHDEYKKIWKMQTWKNCSQIKTKSIKVSQEKW